MKYLATLLAIWVIIAWAIDHWTLPWAIMAIVLLGIAIGIVYGFEHYVVVKGRA